MNKRKIEYRVMVVIFNSPSDTFNLKHVASFESYEEAEKFIMDYNGSELQIHKVYVYE